MSEYVVDASVAMKWFVVEEHTDDALRLRDPAYTLHVPTLFDVEIANILWKKVQRGEVSRADAAAIVTGLVHLPLKRHPILPELDAAFDLALQTQRTVYDCLYLAMAVRLGARMVTGDLRLVNSLAAGSHAAHILWVEDVP